MPTTSLNADSFELASAGRMLFTSARTFESRTRGVMPRSPEPESATPSAQATSRAATALSMAPPTASSARTGCQVILDRRCAPPIWNSACPSEAQMITMKTAASETRIDGLALPRAVGAAQTPISPPSRRPTVAKAPVMKPCQ